ncbi:DUF2214 domain-containing protein [Cereibacter sphaeroides]|uniref:DUF2214 domain-containing protein n=1 Tax=Cereibacter sphaeroides TaxID=1063 RepID=UPI001F259FD7|nr:DUF2214 domain-containing protein [Cereibacter sphaeroides]MCE6952467.1 DUF2214 domain-containing protein [Cereibacter sphaeroides]
MIEILQGWPGAQLLRGSGTAYLLVNAAHILGIGLLLGAILPLDLMLASGARVAAVVPVLTCSAAAGLGLALATGLWLFSVDPAEYLANRAFLVKLPLVAAAVLNLALVHRSRAWAEARSGGVARPPLRMAALLSAGLWLSVLVAGRWIGFL